MASKNTRLSINVTRQDIRKGQRGEPWRCPIAWAAKRAGLYRPAVAGHTIRTSFTVFDKNSVGSYEVLLAKIKLPKKAIRFYKAFDHEEKVKPFKFTVLVDRRAVTK